MVFSFKVTKTLTSDLLKVFYSKGHSPYEFLKLWVKWYISYWAEMVWSSNKPNNWPPSANNKPPLLRNGAQQWIKVNFWNRHWLQKLKSWKLCAWYFLDKSPWQLQFQQDFLKTKVNVKQSSCKLNIDYISIGNIWHLRHLLVLCGRNTSSSSLSVWLKLLSWFHSILFQQNFFRQNPYFLIICLYHELLNDNWGLYIIIRM